MEERPVTVWVLPVLAWAQLELGDTGQAARTIAEALRRQRAAQYRLHLVGALRVQALVAQRQGDIARATQALEEGLALARAIPYPHGEGRLLEAYGRLHLGGDETSAARERLEAALAIFRRLGARRDAAVVEQLLGTLSRAARSGGAAGDLLAHRETGRALLSSGPVGRRLARPERQAWALAHLRTSGPLTPSTYAQALSVSTDTALLDLRELMARGLVRGEGTTRDRRYLLVRAEDGGL
jgi:hypothetical protein